MNKDKQNKYEEVERLMQSNEVDSPKLSKGALEFWKPLLCFVKVFYPYQAHYKRFLKIVEPHQIDDDLAEVVLQSLITRDLSSDFWIYIKDLTEEINTKNKKAIKPRKIGEILCVLGFANHKPGSGHRTKCLISSEILALYKNGKN